MQHHKCGGSYIEKRGDLDFHNKQIGDYTVRDIAYSICDRCGSFLFPLETAIQINTCKKDKLHELVSRIPVANFLSASEAADILGRTRQAFHKNRKIKNGFIYSSVIGGVRIFDRESVKEFKLKGDGRYKLFADMQKNESLPKMTDKWIDSAKAELPTQYIFTMPVGSPIPKLSNPNDSLIKEMSQVVYYNIAKERCNGRSNRT